MTPAALTTAPPARPSWRMTALDLRPLPTAVPCARLHVRLALLGWQVPRAVAETAELIASELVSNAVLHGTSRSGAADTPPVRLRLSGWARGVQVEVWDGSGKMPRLRSDPPGQDELGGRGLVLVAALSSRWGAYRSEGGGKVVWAGIGS